MPVQNAGLLSNHTNSRCCLHRRDQIDHRLLPVFKEHQAVVGRKQRIWNARKARA